MNGEIRRMPSIYLAPMAGITDQVFRQLCFEQGCDGATTEMVSAQGFLTAPKDRNAYRFLLAKGEEEGALAVQIFGSEPHFIAAAAARLADRFSSIDINMGCPAQKVVGGASGSALMKTPELAGEIVAAVKAAVSVPVTVKMRLGWDDAHRNAVSFARVLEDAGADRLTVHGRTRMQQYSGRADWETIAQVKQAVRIPVIANGDVVDGASALACLRVTGCDGLAIGRGALGNPWIFSQVKAALSGQAWTPPSWEQVVETAMRHGREMAAWKGEKSAVLEMRKHFSWYVSGRRGAARVRTQIHLASSLTEVEALLRSLDAENC